MLPVYTIPESITEKIPEAEQRAMEARQNCFVQIGIVGEAVQILHGILESMEVSSSLLEDSVEQQGKSGNIKVINGWKDCDVSITLTLIDLPTIDWAQNIVTPNITRYDCLAEIVGWFRSMKDGKPQIYTIHHPHIKSWGARQFIYNSLKSSESRTKQTITCTLEFDEYDSTSGKSQDRQLGIKTTEKKASAEPQNPVVSDKDRAGLGKLEDIYAKS
jgi:hypothetical protein